MAFDPYLVIIGASLLVAISYIFDMASRKTSIPSVLFLISTGIGLKYISLYFDLEFGAALFNVLELLGIIGLIMIVLEAAVDLKLSRDKVGVIRKSFVLAIIVLVISSIGIAMAIMYFREEPFFNSLVYAIPLSVVSTAVLIPSVHNLSEGKKEFLIYESTFSEILGILFFNFVVIQGGQIFSMDGIMMIFFTVVVSILSSYLLVFFFTKIKTHIKFFLMLAILALLYSLGKQLHLSPLLIILIFGLVLNNTRLFFFGRLRELIDFKSADSVTRDFKIVTGESAFVVRTFFFVTFGFSINLAVLADWRVIMIGTIIVAILYLVRYLNFKIFLKTKVFPEIFLSPRGLITILLFFSIPAQYQIANFSVGILFFVILTTSIIMMIALMRTPGVRQGEVEYMEKGLSPTSSLFANEPSGPHCSVENNFGADSQNKT